MKWIAGILSRMLVAYALGGSIQRLVSEGGKEFVVLSTVLGIAIFLGIIADLLSIATKK